MSGTKENKANMVGVLPSLGADPIPVRLAEEAEGAGMIEKNEVRMVGVLPSQGADPILVSGMLYPSPLSIPPPAFIPRFDTYNWDNAALSLKNRTALTTQYFYAPVYLPNGVTVSELTLYGYRDDALAVMSLSLYRIDHTGGAVLMGDVNADWIVGDGSGSDSPMALPTVDNVNYSYILSLVLDPNDSVNDVKFFGGTLDFTA